MSENRHSDAAPMTGNSLHSEVQSSCPIIPNLEAALAYAAIGWRVMPVHPNKKKPCIRGWQRSASTNPETIRRWWKKFPDARVGILLGRASNIVVIDIDLPHGPDSMEALQDYLGRIDPAVSAFTPSGGQHWYFTYPTGQQIGTSHKLDGFPGVEILSDKAFVVTPPSSGEGGNYCWEASSSPFDDEPGPIPEGLLRLILEQQSKRKPTTQVDSEPKIPAGMRNSTLTILAGSMRRKGMKEESIASALITENKASCNPPLPDDEVRQIARSIAGYSPESPAIKVCTGEIAWSPLPGPARSLDDVLAAAEEYMPGCDLAVLRVILGTYIALLLPTANVWTIVRGGSSSGKSAFLDPLKNLPLVTFASNLSRPVLVSGTSRSQMQPGDPGGLLFEVGTRGLVVVSDIAETLDLPTRRKNELYDALRPIYDGEYSYRSGTGGTARYWKGKLGLIIASTGEIDSRWSFMGDLGPRFLMVTERSDPLAVLENSTCLPDPKTKAMLRQTFFDAVRGFVKSLGSPDELRLTELPEISSEESGIIRNAATLTSMARSPLTRDKRGNSRDADFAEHSHRLIEQFAALCRTFLIMGCSTEDALQDIVRIALNTISPPIRSEILLGLRSEEGPSAYRLSQVIARSETTTGRELEALRLLKLVRCDGTAGSRAWNLTPVAIRILDRLSPFLYGEATC